MKKFTLSICLAIVIALASFSSASMAADTTVSRLSPNTPYTLQDLYNLPQLLDKNCDQDGYELCQTLGHYGVLYLDSYGVQRIPGMFKAADGFWYVTDADTIFDKGGNACYPYIEVAWHQSGACSIGSTNPLCEHYIARAGYVYNWHPADKWPTGETPVVSGYYSVGSGDTLLYCKIQK